MESQRILLVGNGNPWLPWSNSGFLRAACESLRRRDLLYGAIPYFAKSGRELGGVGALGRMGHRVRARLGRSPRKTIWNSEREGFVGQLLHRLPPGSAVIYHYLAPEFDPELRLRRFLFQDLTVHDAVRTRSYGHQNLSEAQIQDKYERHRRAMEQADGILSFSTYGAESIARDFGVPREKITAIGCGPVRSRQPKREPTPERYAAARILFVGRKWERKGGPVLLDAFRHVREAIPHATLHIVGADVKPPAIDGVCYHGLISDRQVGKLFAECSLFCMPAICETWGIAYVEAADSGLPIAGYDAWALPDIVEDGATGRLTSNHTADGLAEIIIEMLSDPERLLEMGRLSRRRVDEVLDWPFVIDRLLSRVLPEALQGREPPPLTRRIESSTVNAEQHQIVD